MPYTRKKKQDKAKQQPLRTPLPSDLPREKEIFEPEDVPSEAKKIGKNITEILEYKPSRLYVRQIIRPKFAVPQTNLEESPVTAPKSHERNVPFPLPSIPYFYNFMT